MRHNTDDDAAFGSHLAQLLEMFPTEDACIVGDALVKAKSLDGAIDRLLSRQPNSVKKRKRTVDIRELFGAPPPDIRLKNTAPPSTSTVPIAQLQQWDPAKEAQRPITLTPATLAAAGLPLTLTTSFLPPDQANTLLHEMLADAATWHTIKWVIFEREVLSPHVSRLYKLDATVPGTTMYSDQVESSPFSLALLAAKASVDAAVNAVLSTRPRHALEAAHDWAANVALANCYKSHHQSVGAHSDALTDLGPRPTIASLTLGAERVFRIKRLPTESYPAQTFNLALPHNSLLIMLPPFQLYRHEVPPVRPNQVKWHHDAKDARINLTFRMLRPLYMTESPLCQCEKRAVLRTVNKPSKASHGEYFYICAGSVPSSCAFFLWLKDRVFPNPQDDKSAN
ncbi:hypothetical protein, variant [Saprolegnia diclina VS20]|uniref:Uncharacterized protein n=1 Tax=Saprolegnia diclina (strain VS20) TaxID=1156394 RepID=T0R497_SAPDV|nr:hypothetical protein, variant [Saprolegnia diclina VS20]EQC41801.1 hypothetical protein, variant [Saprolegnia diclina VS20]|eukprot:XP_008604369.1 hypothetical protein, variant [Saprolegnia diclina VS20]